MKTVVMGMTEKMVVLNDKDTKARNFSDSLVMVPAFVAAYFKNKRSNTKKALFIEVNSEWPEYQNMNQTIRCDNTVLFAEYVKTDLD